MTHFFSILRLKYRIFDAERTVPMAKQLGRISRKGLVVALIFGGIGILVGVFVPLFVAPSPFKYMGLLMGAVMVYIFTTIYKKVIKPVLDKDKLLDNGDEAQAVILDRWETNTRINNNPLIGFRLRIIPDIGDPYETETEHVVSILDITEYVIGRKIKVMVDPMRKENVAIGGVLTDTTQRPLIG